MVSANLAQGLRKAELHLHLEGSVEPETLLEIDPSLDLATTREQYRCATFEEFIRSYIWINRKLQAPEHYGLVTRRCLERLAQQNVAYAEISLSVGMMLWKEQNVSTIFEAISEAADESQVQVGWIFDAIRQFGADHGRQVAELAVERKNDGVVAFGIGGNEQQGPVEWFRDVFQFAQAEGLAIIPHAGETAGPESVWAALRLGARRIGHGISAAEDGELMEHLRREDIPLEVCISSNVCTGAVASLQTHPVRRLYDAGVPITLNSDDPALFCTSLNREYEIAAEHFGFSQNELEGLAANSLRYALRC